jgi:hypothetical protein
MENDSIRASGTDTLIDIWIEGKLRAICVTREAIECFLGTEDPVVASDEARCEFVRTHLAQVATAAKARLRGNADALKITLEAGHLRAGLGRRSGDRRIGDRRKVSRAVEELPHGERRRSDRRGSSRRRKPN